MSLVLGDQVLELPHLRRAFPWHFQLDPVFSPLLNSVPALLPSPVAESVYPQMHKSRQSRTVARKSEE